MNCRRLGEDVFDGPDWKTLRGPKSPSAAGKREPFPSCATFTGAPLKRNFVHVDDLVDAILAALDNPATKGKLTNIAMDQPVDTAAVAAHLKATQGLGSIDIPSACHSNWLDNTPAKLDFNERPAPIWPRSSPPPGLFSAPPTIRGRSRIRAMGGIFWRDYNIFLKYLFATPCNAGSTGTRRRRDMSNFVEY